MAVGLFRLSVFVLLLLLIMVVLKSRHEGNINIDVSSMFLAFGRDKVLYPSRNSGLSRRYRTSSCVPSCVKASAVLYLAKMTMCAGYLILLAGDVSINPGPVRNRVLECPACCKIIRWNQARSSCTLCEQSYHLKCLYDADYDLMGYCRQCSDDSSIDIEELNLLPKLARVMELRGLKILHQNIQSLRCRIDELRLLLHKFNSGVQLLALTETWANRDITDKEYEIPGYNLYRKDRGSKGGGVAVFVRNDLVITRREDLEKSDVEGLWLEIALPKLRSFLLGTFYRAPNSSIYYDKDFMFKLEAILDIAVSQNQEATGIPISWHRKLLLLNVNN